MLGKDIPKSPMEYPNNRLPFNSRGIRGNVSSIVNQKKVSKFENIRELKYLLLFLYENVQIIFNLTLQCRFTYQTNRLLIYNTIGKQKQ